MNCLHTFELWDEYICSKCGIIDTTFQDLKKQDGDETYFWRPISYARMAFLEKTFDLLYDHHRGVPTTIIQLVHDRLPNPFVWKDVYTLTKKYGVAEYFISFPFLLGYKPTYPGTIIKQMIECGLLSQQLGFNKALNNMYTLFKLNQYHGYRTDWIPLKLSLETILKLDDTWEVICRSLNIPFLKTPIIERKIKKLIGINLDRVYFDNKTN